MKPSHLLFSLCLSLSFEAITPFASAIAQVSVQQTPLRTIILPFKNVTGQEDLEWMGQSFAESLTNQLGQAPELEVLERSQIKHILGEQSFQQSMWSPENGVDIGKLVGAQRVLLGSYSLQDDELRIYVRMVSVESGKVDDTVRFNIQGSRNKIFDLQDQLTQRFLEKMSERQKQLPDLRYTHSVLAHKYYQQGLALDEEQSTPEQQKRAFAFYQQALKTDPDYPLPKVRLASLLDTYAWLNKESSIPLPDFLPADYAAAPLTTARRFVEEVLSAYPDLFDAWIAKAYVLDTQGFQKQATQVCKSAPSKSHTQEVEKVRCFLQLFLGSPGNTSLAELNALDDFIAPYLDNDIIISLWLNYYTKLDPDIKIPEARYQRLVALARDQWKKHPQLATSVRTLTELVQRRSMSSAQDILEEALPQLQQRVENYKLIGSMYDDLGQEDEHVKWLEKHLEHVPDDYYSHYILTSKHYVEAVKYKYKDAERYNYYKEKTLTHGEAALRQNSEHLTLLSIIAPLKTYPQNVQLLEKALSIYARDVNSPQARKFSLEFVLRNLAEAYAFVEPEKSMNTYLKLVDVSTKPDEKARYWTLAYQQSSYLSPDPEREKRALQWLNTALQNAKSPYQKAKTMGFLVKAHYGDTAYADRGRSQIKEALALAHANQKHDLRIIQARHEFNLDNHEAVLRILESPEMETGRSDSMYLMSETLFHLGEYQKAANWLKRYILKENPSNPFYGRLYQSYVLWGRIDKDPDNASLHHDLGIILTHLKFYGAAKDRFTEAIRLAPQQWQMPYAMGSMLLQKEEYTSAIPYLKKALALRNNQPDVMFNLGLAYLHTGQKQKARQFLTKLQARQPNYSGLQDALLKVE